MKNLLIIGARGFGREVYNLAVDVMNTFGEFKIKGFLDDNPYLLAGIKGYPPIIDSVENYWPAMEDIFVCALGDIESKQKYVKMVTEKGGAFINLIHPKSIIRQNTQFGTGCIVQPLTLVSNEVFVGDFVTILAHSIIGHDSRIGNWCHLGALVFLGGFVTIADNVTIHTRATILPGLTISINSTVGAGSVVIRDVEPGITIFGNPAKKIFPL